MNTLYPAGLTAFGSAQINLLADNIKLALVSAGYVYSSAHQFYSDLTPASNVVGIPVAFTGKTVSAGVFNATSPVVFPSVSGSQVNFLVIYKDTGTTTTSPLIAFIDTATNIPVQPNGGSITISLDTGVSKIFSL